MVRNETKEQKAEWAAYMREYRARKPSANRRNENLPPTQRQVEILRMYADPTVGGTQEKVAEALGISKSAVHNQLQRLMRRLGVHTPAQAVMKLWVNPIEPTDQAVPNTDAPAGRRLRRPRHDDGNDRTREDRPEVASSTRRAG